MYVRGCKNAINNAIKILPENAVLVHLFHSVQGMKIFFKKIKKTFKKGLTN